MTTKKRVSRLEGARNDIARLHAGLPERQPTQPRERRQIPDIPDPTARIVAIKASSRPLRRDNENNKEALMPEKTIALTWIIRVAVVVA